MLGGRPFRYCKRLGKTWFGLRAVTNSCGQLQAGEINHFEWGAQFNLDKHYEQVKEEKKKANPRISCLDQLGDMNLRRVVVPTLTLTEGTPTPKKFFKSGNLLTFSTPTLKVAQL